MKIELGEEHFNKSLDCPNCNAMFTLPDPNELKDMNTQLKREIEELKNSSNKLTNTNTVAFKRKMGTLKVGKADLIDEDTGTSANGEEIKKLNVEIEQLHAKLKGMQAANLTLNQEISSLKDKGDEADKGIEKVKELQKELSEKDERIALLEKEKLKQERKLSKFTELSQKIQLLAAEKEKTINGDVDVLGASMPETQSIAYDDMAETKLPEIDDMAETQVPGMQRGVDLMAETAIGPSDNAIDETIDALEELDGVSLDETLELSITAIQEPTSDGTVKVPGDTSCNKCGARINSDAEFCFACGAKQ